MVILAGVLLALAFAPFSIWVCAPLAYLLLINALRKSSKPVIASFSFGLTSHLLILSWAKNYVGVPPYLALAFLQALFSIPLGLHLKLGIAQRWLPLTLLAAEFLRAHIPFGGFGWTNPGFTQNDSFFARLAPLGGVYLIAVVLASLAVTRNRYQVSLLLLLVIAGYLYHPTDSRKQVSVAAVQGGVVTRTQSYYDDIRKVFKKHFDLTKDVSRVDVVLWPEDVVDGNPHDREFAPFFEELRGRDIILGASPMVRGMPENQSLHLSSSGLIESRYSKIALVPFGEYIPLRSIVDRLNSHVDEVIDYRPGRSLILHSIKGEAIASLICFEVVDDQRVRNAARAGTLLLSQTNSATFIGTAQSQQQFEITRMRAREYSRTIAGVSTVGITGFIDNNGKVTGELPQNKPGVLYGELGIQDTATPYALFPFLSLLFALFFGLVGKDRDGLGALK